jgi:hypothetical protein
VSDRALLVQLLDDLAAKGWDLDDLETFRPKLERGLAFGVIEFVEESDGSLMVVARDAFADLPLTDEP